MRLRSLRLQNYRRYRDAYVEFPDGVLAIVGPNGAGKSTLLEAVTWCLYGHEAARTGKDLIKSDGAAPGEDAVVRLEFELDGHAYTMTRRIRGRTLQADAQLDCDGQVLVAAGANSSDQATAFLARTLGLDREAFHATVVARQGELSALSDRTASARKRLILGMLGIDEVEGAIRLVRASKRETAARLDEVRRTLARAPELRQREVEARRQLEATQADRDRWAQERTERARKAETADRAAGELSDALGRHRELRGHLEGLQRSLQVTQAQRLRLGSDLQLLSQKQAQLRLLEGHRPAHEQAEADWDRLRRERAAAERRGRLEADVARLRTEEERWRGQLNRSNGHDATPLGPSLDAARRRVAEARDRVHHLEMRAQALEGELRRLQVQASRGQDEWRGLLELGPEAPCPTCHRPLGEAVTQLAHDAAEHQGRFRGQVQQVQDELTTLPPQLAVESRVLEEAEADAERHQAAVDHARSAAARHGLVEVELRRTSQAAQTTEVELAALPILSWDTTAWERAERAHEEAAGWREQLVRLQESLERVAPLQQELAVLTAEEERTRSDIMVASRELGRLGYVEGSSERAAAEAHATRARLQEAERECLRLQERAELLEQALATARQDLAHVEDVGRQREALEGRLRVEEVLAADHGDKGLFPDFKNYLIARIRPALARAAADLVSQMTSGRYRDLEVDEEYEVHVFDQGRPWPIERYSGGEADVINLALRLAVSELVLRARSRTRLRFVALDEVLANQDEARRRSVLQALKSLQAQFRQVFLVTHWDEVRDGVDNVVRVEPQPDGTSRLWCSWDEKV